MSEAVKRPPITDSAWYWVLKFSLAGVVAATAISLKYDRRQANIERNYQARTRVAERLTAANNSADVQRLDHSEVRRAYAAPGNRLIPIWPLALLLGIVAVFAGGMLQRERSRLRAMTSTRG